MADYTLATLIGNNGAPFDAALGLKVETPSPLKAELATPTPLSTTVKIEPTEATVHTDSSVTSDVRLTFVDPMTVDFCVNVNLGRLPPTRVRQPYRHRLGITLFGVEVLGFEMDGELDTLVEEAPRHPVTVCAESPDPDADTGRGGGLRVRVGR